ncbi:MAG: ArnT family glycosyltransferase [Terriglobales bacterium]
MENASAGRKRSVLIARWGAGAGVCALGWATLLAGLGSFGLLGPDEPRYAAIAAAMARTSDWITPHLWGAPWLEKPVLYYWLAASSDRLQHAATAASSRLPNALLAAAMVLGLFFFVRRLSGARAGTLAVVMGLSSAFVFAFGRAATTDMTLTALFALGMMALYLWLYEDRGLWLHLAAAAFALATLAKGPVALVLGALALAGFAAVTGRWRLFGRLFRPTAVILYFVVAAPWYIAVEVQNHGFFHSFFLQQNLERMATNRYQHPQPVWFYLPVILLAVFPWTGWFGLPLSNGIRRLRRRGWRAGWNGNDAPVKFFLLCWLLAPLLFFTLSASKLPGYILPAVPAAVALIAVCAAERWGKLPRWPLVISAVLAGIIPTAVALAPWFLATSNMRLPFATVLERNPGTLVLAVLGVIVLLFFAVRRRGAAYVAAACILTAGGVLALTRPPLSQHIDVALSGRALGRSLYAQCGTALPEACGALPVYAANVNRGRLYGAQFVLGARLRPWPAAGALPDDALVIIHRRSIMPFAEQLGLAYNVAVQPRFIPPEARSAPPWVVVRVKRVP